MYNFQTKQMKNLIFKTTSIFSLFSLGFLSTMPAVGGNKQYGENSFRPDSLKVTFYEIGLSNADLSNVFSVLNSTTGVESNIADPDAVNNLVTGVEATPGTYTHFYAVISNTYKVKGSSNGCYTKSGSYKLANSVYNYKTLIENDISDPCDGCTYITDGYSAATSSLSGFGEATITEQAYGVGDNGEPDSVGNYGPATPSTTISVGGLEVNSMDLYLTNSSNPYSYIAENTPLNELPASSTRDRALYLGELSQSVTVEEGSKGIVQLYFDFSKGMGFDDDCDSIQFNSNYFDMSVITE